VDEPVRRPLEVVDGQIYGDWESVYRGNVVGVYRAVHARVGNRPDAEDLTTEVFLQALPRLRLPASVPGVRAYLAATSRTVLADHWRQHYAAPPTTSFEDELDPATLGPQGNDGRGEAWAHRVLALLPDQFRRVLELRFLRGYSVSETAAELGVSVGNARVLQYRALRSAAAVEDGSSP
jgi:RNA polymerase sigma factor (sigma-70 family)